MSSISGAVLQLLFYDSVLFFTALIISAFYIYKHHRGTERYVFYIYLIITLSITNIFVKPVQDYLIPIPRTYIYYYKLFAGLSIFDILIIVIFCYICIKYLSRIKYRRIFFSCNLLTKIFKCDSILLSLSFVGFGVYMLGDNPIDYVTQIRCCRLILNIIVVVFIAQIVINKYTSDKDIFRLISTLFFLNFIVYFSEFLSSFFIKEICWERAGHKVSLLDQTGAGMALIYVPFILCKTPYLKRWMSLSAYFFLALLVYNSYKTWLLAIGITTFIMIYFGLLTGKIQKRLFLFSLIGILSVSLFVVSVSQSESNSVNTRKGQNEMLYKTFKENLINVICGIGHGGMIRKQTITEDGGETRAIDLENNESAKYVTTYQVPFFNIIKFSGIIGMLVCINLFILMLKNSFSIIKYGWYFSYCIAFMAVMLLLGTRLFYSDPQMSIYYVEAYVVFKLLLQRQIRIIDSTKNSLQGKNDKNICSLPSSKLY